MKTIFICGNETDYPNYINALQNLGAKVLVTQDDYRAAECDALLLPGGGDVRPSLYGQDLCGSNEPDDLRDANEMRVIARFLALDRPILGICRGLQILNIAFGGTLIQDIPNHSRVNDCDRVHMTHTNDTLLSELYGDCFSVNSAHHQVIDQLGIGLQAIQWSEDGHIEAIKHMTKNILGLQWHPERMCFNHRRSDTVDGSRILLHFLNAI